MRCAVFYHPDFADKGYSTLKHRVKPGFDALQGIISQNRISVITPEVEEETKVLLAETHSQGHIDQVKYEGYHDVALRSAAGVIKASEMLAGGELDFAFCFVGTAGHHAAYGGSWGFCYYNDAAMAVKKLRRSGVKRIMIIDIDPHFGDGTRSYVGLDRDVIHINFHEDDKQLISNPTLNNYDIGLDGTSDREFLAALNSMLDKGWDFDFLIVIFGHDSHCLDYGDFFLSDAAYPEIARRLSEFSGDRPVLMVLSGGSNPQVAQKVIPAMIEPFLVPRTNK